MRHFFVAAFIAACSHPSAPTSVTGPAATARGAAPVAAGRVDERFEYQVRADYFDGVRGDRAALERAIKVCEDTLAHHPDHVEAMVWHGAGLLARASFAFRAGDAASGMKQYGQGLAEMDRAVELAPSNVGVRIPRGAVVLATAPYVPEPEKSRLLQRGVADYEVTLAAQAAYFSTLTLHAREQLLYGLADGYASLGDPTRARAYAERMTTDAAGSVLIARAGARAAGQAVTGDTPCLQCHGRASRASRR